MSEKVAGIVMECNPFHEGHAYLLKKARSECDHVIVVMSGDFVQRGIPAIENKEKRTMDILRGGADLVFELPVPYATGGAGYFAKGAVTLLAGLSPVTDLYFGSESGDPGMLQRAAAFLSGDESASYQTALKDGMALGLSFPAARERAAKTEGIDLPKTPNDLLAVEYLSCLKGSSITAHAVKRITTDSASTLRERALLSDPTLPHADTFSQALLHALVEHENELSSYVDVSEDLANRMRNLLPSFVSFGDYALLLKTRDLTYTRVCRALLHVLLGIQKEDMASWQENGCIGYARLLGRRKSAAPLLASIAKSSALPLILSPARDRQGVSDPFMDMLQLDERTSFLYDVLTRSAKKDASPVPRESEKRLLVFEDSRL